MEELRIALSSWIIQDGNYGDFSVGEEADFALEFYDAEPLQLVKATESKLVHQGDAIYSATGRVFFADKEWWAVDFGPCMYRDHPPPNGIKVGDWVTGQIGAGIDPFFYFERLAKQPTAPPLTYRWAIDAIEMEMAPFVEVAPRRFERDAAKRARKRISQTDAWNDDNGNADYVLTCRTVGGPFRPS